MSLLNIITLDDVESIKVGNKNITILDMVLEYRTTT
jgi:hypothetical protein